MNQKEFYGKVYDTLIEVGGAPLAEKESFVDAHVKGQCCEWRFRGKFGFGGKYWQERNKINCYPEAETPERLKLIQEINKKLAVIKNSYKRK